MKQAVLFSENDFHGNHVHVFRREGNLELSQFQDRARSIVIQDGLWVFYREENFQSPYRYGDVEIQLGVGTYTFQQLRDNGIEAPLIRSLKAVD